MAPRRRNASAKQPAQDSRDPVENAAKGKLENRRKKDQISDEVRDCNIQFLSTSRRLLIEFLAENRRAFAGGGRLEWRFFLPEAIWWSGYVHHGMHWYCTVLPARGRPQHIENTLLVHACFNWLAST